MFQFEDFTFLKQLGLLLPQKQKIDSINDFTCQKHPQGDHMKDTWDFPGDPVVKNLPANAEDTGSISGPGRSHMSKGNWACALQLLSSQSRAHKVKLLNPMYLQPMLHDKKSHHDEKPKHRN